jgi:hypothetical protein
MEEMTTKVIIEVPENERSSIVVMENFVGQRQNRTANVIAPGKKKEFQVHSHLNLQIMEVSNK